MKPQDASAIVLLVQTFAQIERGEILSGGDRRALRHNACQRFRDNVREEPLRFRTPGGPRPMVDALLITALEMVFEVHHLNYTGETYYNILNRARARLYERIDTGNMSPPPAEDLKP